MPSYPHRQPTLGVSTVPVLLGISMILAGVAGTNTFLSTQRQPTLRVYTIPVLLRISMTPAGVAEINDFSSTQTTNIESAYCTCSPGEFHDTGGCGRNKHLIYTETTNIESVYCTCSPENFHDTGRCGRNKHLIIYTEKATLRVYTVPVLLGVSMILAGVAGINAFSSNDNQH